MNDINLRIAELRKKKGMTQEDLAKLLDISPQSVSKWETRNAYPDITLLPKLSEILESSADYILGIDSDFNPDLYEMIKKEFTSKDEEKRFAVALEISSILFEGIAANGFREDVISALEPTSFIGVFGKQKCLFHGKEGFVAYLQGMGIFGSFDYLRKTAPEKSSLLSEIFSAMGDEKRLKLLIKWSEKVFEENNPAQTKAEICDLAGCGTDEILSIIKPLIKSGLIIREVTDDEEIMYRFPDGMICLIYPLVVLANAVNDIKLT